MKTITILTATRAEYGLLSPIIHKLIESKRYHVKVVVTGAHLSPEFGLTYKEIEDDGIQIDKKIEILVSADTPSAISKSMGMAMIGFADYFAANKSDALLVLGDRYETLAVACVAMNARIPIIHLYGGETTEGAVDEAIRHAVTKLSYLHLTSTEEYRRRVIQLGEAPERVVTIGSVGIENALHKKLLTKTELEEQIGMSLEKPYAVVTFHPVTLENSTSEEQCQALLEAIKENDNMVYIITKANADHDGRIINTMLERFSRKNKNVKVFDSLGTLKYLSALRYASVVIGNSSSGIVEVPSFKIPTINVGDRQKGRLRAESVIDCETDTISICKAINIACSDEFREKCKNTNNPYGDGEASEKALRAIDIMFSKDICLKKRFYNK